MNTYSPTPELKIADDVYKTGISGLLYLPHHKYPDQRGFYAEVARIPEIEPIIGRSFEIKQVNHSRSNKNVARGFHAEAWNKLITPASGKIMSVLVDIRPESDTFGQKEIFILGADEGALDGAIFVSQGIANGFLILDGPADYIYLVDKLYAERDPAGDRSINLFDPDIAMEWPLAESEMTISDRDRDAVSLRERFPEKF